MCRGGFEHRAELRSGAGVWAGRRSDRNSGFTCRGGGNERHRRLAPARYRDTDLEKPVEVLTPSLSREPDFFHSMAASKGGHDVLISYIGEPTTSVQKDLNSVFGSRTSAMPMC